MPPIQRVQTGVRIEKRTLKVLKALAEYLDLSLGNLLEGIVLHAFEGRSAFSNETLAQIRLLRGVYALELNAADSHQLREVEEEPARPLTSAPRTSARRASLHKPRPTK